MKRWQHLQFEAPLKPRASRRMAMATWYSRLQNPQASVCMDLDVTRAISCIEHRRQQGERVTLTHLMAATLGRLLHEVPELRSVIRRNQIYPRKDTSLLIQVAVNRNHLSAVAIHSPDAKTPSEIASELEERIKTLKEQNTSQFDTANVLMLRLPMFAIRWLLRFVGHWSYQWNLHPRIFGLPADPYGCMRLNNLGALGIDDGIGPYVDWMHSPGTFVMMRVRDDWVMTEQGPAIQKKLRLWASVDHRLVDGGVFPEARAFIERCLYAPDTLWTTPSP